MKEQIEKQAIKEIAKVIKSSLDGLGSGNFNFTGDEISIMFAKALHEQGYRKQSEVRKTKGCEYCKGRAYTKKPLTVITKYGRRIELVFEFCPNCGRKMKGGAE